MCVLCYSPEIQAFHRKKSGEQYYFCVSCGLVFLDPKMQLTESQDLERYGLHQNTIGQETYRAFLEKFLSRMEPEIFPGAVGLDYGCGEGEGARILLARRGKIVSNYDYYFFPSSDALSISYDFILCSETCEHFRYPALEFSRLFHLLRPGAWLAIRTEFRPDNFATWHYHRDATHICFYSEAVFMAIAKKFGFSIEYCENPFVLLRKPNYF